MLEQQPCGAGEQGGSRAELRHTRNPNKTNFKPQTHPNAKPQHTKTNTTKGTSEEDRRRLLTFVVVGGGPTGVEFAGTLSDFLKADLARKYPDLMGYVKVTLLQSAQSILTTFSAPLQAQAIRNFEAAGIDVRLGVRVTAVERDAIKLTTKDGAEEALPYGVCVWSTGNAARPLVRDLVASVPDQAALNAGAPPAAVKLAVDPYLRVIGEGV